MRDFQTLSFIVDNVASEVIDLRNKGIKSEEHKISETEIKTVNGIAPFTGMKADWFKDTESNIISISEISKNTVDKFKRQVVGIATSK